MQYACAWRHRQCVGSSNWYVLAALVRSCCVGTLLQRLRLGVRREPTQIAMALVPAPVAAAAAPAVIPPAAAEAAAGPVESTVAVEVPASLIECTGHVRLADPTKAEIQAAVARVTDAKYSYRGVYMMRLMSAQPALWLAVRKALNIENVMQKMDHKRKRAAQEKSAADQALNAQQVQAASKRQKRALATRVLADSTPSDVDSIVAQAHGIAIIGWSLLLFSLVCVISLWR